MFENCIYKDSHINLTEQDGFYYIKVSQKGYTIEQFNKVLKQFPRVKITEFNSLKTSFNTTLDKFILIGEQKPLVEITISSDELEAKAKINLSQKEFDEINKKAIITSILRQFQNYNIAYGYDIHSIASILVPNQSFVIAKGTLPIKGDDALITYYELAELQPRLLDDGKVNHYELNLINKVDKGDWLGERIEPKEGTPGKTVTGKTIPAQKGHQEPLRYDHKSVREEYHKQADKTCLYAQKTGAVTITNDVIGVSDYLEIQGSVDYDTGNIDFDGLVDVSNSVEDNFTVRADNDIQILGDLGVGAVDEIESRDGNIYIKGGIAGKGMAKIICNGDLFTKYVSDCEIECTGTVHIGFYAFNATIKAKEILFDSPDSRVHGGLLEADVRIKVGIIGNRSETPTKLHVKGFKRKDLKKEYDTTKANILKVEKALDLVKQKIALYTIAECKDDPKKMKALLNYQDNYQSLQKTLITLKNNIKKLKTYLTIKGEGEICIQKRHYPKVHISIKSENYWTTDLVNKPLTVYHDGNELIKG